MWGADAKEPALSGEFFRYSNGFPSGSDGSVMQASAMQASAMQASAMQASSMQANATLQSARSVLGYTQSSSVYEMTAPGQGVSQQPSRSAQPPSKFPHLPSGTFLWFSGISMIFQ